MESSPHEKFEAASDSCLGFSFRGKPIEVTTDTVAGRFKLDFYSFY